MASDITKLLKKAVVGTNPQGGAMIFQTGAPLDDRFVVRDKAALISESAFTSIGYLYQGLVCTDESTGDVYVLTDAPSASNNFLKKDAWFVDKTDAAIISEIELHWKKLAFAADVNNFLETLSGVFQFKGVAESVSPDLSYIAICSDTSDHSVVPVGTAADLEGDLYYGWSIEGNEFWTESSSLDSESTQYVQSGPISVLGIEYNKDFYYLADAMPVGDDFLYAELKNLKGNSVFIPAGAIPINAGDSYPVYSSQDDVTGIGTGIGFYYKRYRFSENEAPLTISHTHTAILANETNSGHVYQIGENEYASNGQIWVKLGSPSEDWIVIE